MKHEMRSCLSAFIFSLMFVAACAHMAQPQTPAQRLAIIDSQFTALVNTASDLREQGTLTDEYVDEVDALIQNGHETLNAGWRAIGREDEDTALSTLRAMQQLTGELQRMLREAQDG